MSDEQPIKSKKYHAFISYRHADNKESGRQWATWLHQALETYEVPTELVGKTNGRGETIPSRIYPVFRDEQELPADADLGSSIKQALEQTNVLVVLCSPQAVASTYVAEEIDYFKKLGHSERIIAAIIDGEPNASWDSGKQELGFTATDECFPKPLQLKYDDNGLPTQAHTEPVAADFRINNDGIPEQGWTTPEAYKQHLTANTELDSDAIEKKVSDYQQQQKLMLLKIVAGILGIPLGELTQRDKAYQLAQERLRAKKLRRWVSALFILTILAIGAGGFAYLKQQEAERQTVVAEQKTIEAQAQTEIAEQQKAEAQAQTIEANHNYALALNEKAIQAEKEGNIEYAKLYALHALENSKGTSLMPKSLSILGKNGFTSKHIGFFPSASLHNKNASAFPKNDKRNLNLFSNNSIEDINKIVFHPNGEILASISENSITLWEIETGKILKEIQENQNDIYNVRFLPDGKNMVFSSLYTIVLWNLETGEAHKFNNKELIVDLIVSPDGATIAVLSFPSITNTTGYKVALIDVENRKSKVFFEKGISEISFLSRGGTLTYISEGVINFLDIATQKSRKLQDNNVKTYILSTDGKILASASEESISLWDIQNDKLNFIKKIEYSNQIDKIYFSSNNQHLVIVSQAGITIVDIVNNKLKELKVLQKKSHDSVVYSYKKNMLSYIAKDNSIVLLNIPSGKIVHRLKKHTDWVRSIAFSPNGSILASSSNETIILFDTEKNKILNQSVGHFADINSIAFSSDNLVVASGSEDNSVILWNLAKARQMAKIAGFSSDVMSVGFSSNNKWLAVASHYGTGLWDKQNLNARPIKLPGADEVSFSPNGKLLALVLGDTINIWDVEKNKKIQVIKAGSYINSHSMDFSSDNKMLAFYSANKITIWDIINDKPIITIPSRSPIVLRFAINPKRLVSISSDNLSEDNKLRVWDTESGEQVFYYQLNNDGNKITHASLSSDKTLLAFSQDKMVTVLDLLDLNNKKKYKFFSSISSLAFSNDSRLLAVSNAGTLKLLNVVKHNDMQDSNHFFGNLYPLYDIEFSPDGKTLASTSTAAPLLWDVASKKKAQRLFGHATLTADVAFSPNGKWLASASYDNTIILWNKKGEQLHRFIENLGNVNSVAFSPDSKILASGYENNTIILWDVEKREKLRPPLEGHFSPVMDVSFSPDGKYLASGSKNNTIIIWNTVSFNKQQLNGHTFSFSPDGKILAFASGNGNIILKNIESGEQLKTFKGHSNYVNAIAFSPDGKLLVSSSIDKTVIFWDAQNAKPVSQMQGESYHYMDIVFSPDGSSLALGAKDGSITVWGVDNLKKLQSSKNIKTIITNLENESHLILQGVKVYPSQSALNLYQQKKITINYPKTHPFHWLPLAEKGNANAMLQLGIIEHRDSHWKKAKEWYEKARDAGNPDAQERLRILALTKQYAEKEEKTTHDSD